LNHLPLTGLGVALLALLAGMVVRRRAVMLVGLGLVAMTAGSAWPVYEYGEKSYDRVYAMADDEGRVALDSHAKQAKKWIKLFYLTVVIAGAGIGVSWKWPKSLLPISLIVALLSVFCLMGGYKVAEEGGKIRHREFRP